VVLEVRLTRQSPANCGWRVVAGYFKGYFVGRSVRDVEDILLRKRWQGWWPCVVRKEKRARVGSRNSIQESPGFDKNIKKSGALIMGVRGLDTSSPSSNSNSRSYSSLYI
jgi:hypothetical protein